LAIKCRVYFSYGVAICL